MSVEFTGERVIPGQVNADLLNEHLARYAFAARLARGKRVLDAGCGAGYGAAELAQSAHSVVGVDIAAEAVAFAGAHYRLPYLAFEQASCTTLPHPDAAFDLVVAFEVIEHLPLWRDFLLEVRRVLAPTGQFIVSTPNKLYYAESRRRAGANPFHAHEFEFDEFRGELSAVFPHISLFLENHVEGVAFRPVQAGGAGETTEVRVDGGETPPAESHFFVAVCAHRPQTGHPTFVYVPSAANVLRERETHIALLEDELRRKDDWLEETKRDLADLDREHRKLTAELEESNRWAGELDSKLAARGARVQELQEELSAEQAAASARVQELREELWAEQAAARARMQSLEEELAADRAAASARMQSLEDELATERAAAGARMQSLEDELATERAAAGARIQNLEDERAKLEEELWAAQAAAQTRITDLDRENRAKSEWAAQLNAQLDAKMQELAQCVEYLHQAEKTVDERTRWAQQLDTEVEQLRRKLEPLRRELEQLRRHLAVLEASRWVRLGRRVGLGPGADPQ